MNLPVIYEDADVLVVDKPAGAVVFPEGSTTENTLIDHLIAEHPELKSAGLAPRYGVVHRLDKDTSGILLVAKNTESLIFLQKQFKNRRVEKKYTALVAGAIKEDSGVITAPIGRSPKDPRKQKVYGPEQVSPPSARDAITEYQVLQRFAEYTLLEVTIKTGRKHQIRAHLAFIHHPVSGDKLYGFKDSPTPDGLPRQFLHASYIKIQLPSGTIKALHSDLPEEIGR